MYRKQDPRLREHPTFYSVTELCRKIGVGIAIPFIGVWKLLTSPRFYALLFILACIALALFVIFAGVHFCRKFW